MNIIVCTEKNIYIYKNIYVNKHRQKDEKKIKCRLIVTCRQIDTSTSMHKKKFTTAWNKVYINLQGQEYTSSINRLKHTHR